MKTKCEFPISSQHPSFSKACMAAVILLFSVLAGSAQTGRYVYTGAERTINLGPGIYDITAYGAQGGNDNYAGETGGLGAEMEGEFSFTSVTTLILLVGGVGGLSTDAEFGTGAGGGGGSFVVDGSTPLVIAGGGGGAGQQSSGANIGTSGSAGGFSNVDLGGVGGGAGGYSGAGGGLNGGLSFLSGGGGVGNGGFGGGGGSYIDSSAIADLVEVSGVVIPDDPGYGEIFITAVPEPTTLAMVGLGGLSLLLFRRQRK
jgi:PEP-CTERM motif